MENLTFHCEIFTIIVALKEFTILLYTITDTILLFFSFTIILRIQIMSTWSWKCATIQKSTAISRKQEDQWVKMRVKWLMFSLTSTEELIDCKSHPSSRAIKITQITRNSLNDHKDVFLFSFHKRDKIQYLQQIYICGIMQIEEGVICWEWNYNIACQCNYAKYRSAPHNNDNDNKMLLFYMYLSLT